MTDGAPQRLPAQVGSGHAKRTLLIGELRSLELDDETLAAAMLKLGSLGSFRTTTLWAFSADEMRAVIAKAG